MFKYNYVADLFNRLVKNADFPMQVELHPGPHCGGMHCRYCYGKGQKINDNMLSIKEYEALLTDVEGKTNLIDISGIVTDPLSYPHFYELIDLIKTKRFHFGIHTKGYLLTPELCKLLNYGDTDGNFITLSIDSTDPKVYNRLHGISNKLGNVFDQTLKKIKLLKEEKEKRNSELRINIGYLLFQENSKRKDIENFIEIFSPIANVLRFSIPQVPNKAKPIGYLPNENIASTLEMLREYEKEQIVVLKFDYSQHDHSFDTCWSQRFNITIDNSGFVFPCPQVASSPYNHLSYGNLREQTIWEIWNSKLRKEILEMDIDKQMKCRVCDRKDENINIELEKILAPHKYI